VRVNPRRDRGLRPSSLRSAKKFKREAASFSLGRHRGLAAVSGTIGKIHL
jgi:hypothetical protein